MKIDNRDYKINVLILLMEHEIDVTIHTVETLLETIEQGVVISILLNGSSSPKLSKLFSKHGCIRYYESETNLGVAGGRNLLLKTEECKTSDIIFNLDNDVIPPLDYIRSLATFLIKQKNAGVVGAVVTRTNFLRFSVNNSLLEYYGDRGVFENRIFKLDCENIRRYMLSTLNEYNLYHIGSHVSFYYAYLSPRRDFYNFLNIWLGILRLSMFKKKNYNPHLIHNGYYLELIKKGQTYTVSNVAGCSQAFKRSLVEKIGYLDDRHSPYGLEDVDFCIRSIKEGYENYIDPNTWLMHGTDGRHAKMNNYTFIFNFFRCLTLISATHYPKNYKYIMLKLIFGRFFFELVSFKRSTFPRLKAMLRGFLLLDTLPRTKAVLRGVYKAYKRILHPFSTKNLLLKN